MLVETSCQVFGRVGLEGSKVREGNTVLIFLVMKALPLHNFIFNLMVPIAAL